MGICTPFFPQPDLFASLAQGLEDTCDKKKVLKALKKEFCCNGTVVEDPELGQVSTPATQNRKSSCGCALRARFRVSSALRIKHNTA